MNVKYTYILVLALTALTVTSCKPGQLDAAAMVKYAEDPANGLVSEKKVSDYYFSAQYKPVDYLLAKEITSGSITEADAKKRRTELDGMEYFNFKIDTRNQSVPMLKMGIADETGYFTRLQYFINGQERFKLCSGNDTLPCRLYHFEQSYGLAPYNNMVLGFERKNKQKIYTNDLTLVYEDAALGTGSILLTLKKDDLNNVPQLTIQ